ncbi:MAG: RNB domain-containing ribonuclease [Proteobacteria bacterium]|nr:RNB domain-containing ribonuclease [Pseudomonadota bacterium]MBU1639300.1 RNB domain-containing ribonuclease [Pseudomonadota bacterium]
MNQNGREMKLPLARIVHVTDKKYSAASREDIMALLQETAARRQAMMEPINLQEIWELAVSEEQSSFPALFFAELAFAEDVTDDHVAAFLRCVFADKFYFKFKEGQVLVHSQEVVEQLQVMARKEQDKEALLENGAHGLRAIYDGDAAYDWPERKRCLEMVEAFYLQGNDAKEAATCRELLKRADLGRPHDPYYVLVRAGVWHKDENIALLKSDLPAEFSQAEEEAALKVQELRSDFCDEGRLDLRDKPLLTIDAPSTRDLDDALHLEKKGENFLVGIHIADVSHYVRPGDLLFDTARERATSTYMADRQIAMLPHSLSENGCSLIAGVDRPAISTLVELTPAGEVVHSRIVRSVVNVKRRLSYDEAVVMAEGKSDEEIVVLTDLAQKLLARRVAAGAVVMPVPDVNIRVGEKVTVSLADSDSLSRSLVAEFMVLANVLGAQYVSSRMEPGIYRSQDPPRQRLFEGLQRDLFLNFRQRRCLSRGHLLTMAKSHSGVGADCYTTVTSPIRRFLDLVMQHQLAGIISRKGTPFTEKDCKGFVGNILHGVGRANRVRSQRHRYWLLRYLEESVGVGNSMAALVLDIQDRRVQVVLTDILLEGDLPLSSAAHVEAGEMITVKLAKVNVLDNNFRLEW